MRVRSDLAWEQTCWSMRTGCANFLPRISPLGCSQDDCQQTQGRPQFRLEPRRTWPIFSFPPSIGNWWEEIHRRSGAREAHITLPTTWVERRCRGEELLLPICGSNARCLPPSFPFRMVFRAGVGWNSYRQKHSSWPEEELTTHRMLLVGALRVREERQGVRKKLIPFRPLKKGPSAIGVMPHNRQRHYDRWWPACCRSHDRSNEFNQLYSVLFCSNLKLFISFSKKMHKKET